MMHCIDDKPNGIILNHNPDWSGNVRLAWYAANERRDPGPTPASLRECWCSGPDLIAGRFTPAMPPDGKSVPETVPPSWAPVEIITRAVALAVESCNQDRGERVTGEDLKASAQSVREGTWKKPT